MTARAYVPAMLNYPVQSDKINRSEQFVTAQRDVLKSTSLVYRRIDFVLIWLYKLNKHATESYWTKGVPYCRYRLSPKLQRI